MNKIYLIGDSTCQNNTRKTYPQHGWGQVFSAFISNNYRVINLAKNGRSSKSFLKEGLFKPCEDNISTGDYLFIQFGHNDEKEDIERHTDPFTTYQNYLRYYINAARKNNATPILLSSIYRRHFDEFGKIKDNCHLDYPKAMEELAKQENVIYIDMCNLTKELLSGLGDEKSKELFMNFKPNIYKNYPEGKIDNTHLTTKGAKAVCKILVSQIKGNDKINQILKKWF